MLKISKYVLLVGFLFFSTIRLFPSVSTELEPKNNINILNNGNSDKKGILGLKLEPYDDGKTVLIEVESPFKIYNGFLFVSENQVFNRLNLEKKDEEKLSKKIQNSNYGDSHENIGQLFIDGKFVKAKDLIVGDQLVTAGFGYLNVKNIFNVKLNEKNSSFLSIKKNNYSFFNISQQKNIYIKNFFSIDNIKGLALGASYGASCGVFLSSALLFLMKDGSFYRNLIKISFVGGVIGATAIDVVFLLLLRLEKNAINFDENDLVSLQGKRILDFSNLNFLSKKIKNISDNDINLIDIDFVDESECIKGADSSNIHKEFLCGEDGNLIKDKGGKVACLLVQKL